MIVVKGCAALPNKRMQLTRCGVTRAAEHPARRVHLMRVPLGATLRGLL